MSRMKSISVDPVLTEFTRGEKIQNLYYEALFPNVKVEKEHGKVPAFSTVLEKDYNTVRALRADSNIRLSADVDKVEYLCEEHDIAAPLDYRELNESDFKLELRESISNKAIIEYKKELIAAELATNALNFETSNVEALSGKDVFDDPDSKPLTLLGDAISTLQLNLGADYELNMVISKEVWKVLKEHESILSKIQYAMKGVVTSEILKELLDFKGNIIIADSVHDKKFIWGKNIVLGVIPKKINTVYTPSFGYTFQKKGYPLIDSWMSEDRNTKKIRYKDCFDMKIMDKKSGFLISNCIS